MDNKLLDLRKEKLLNITKELKIEAEKAEIKLVLDISGSMSSDLSNGAVQKVLERLIPIALKFDDDQEIEVYPFHHEAMGRAATLTLSNIDGYVTREITKKYSLGGTSYAPVINTLSRDVVGGGSSISVEPESQGFLSRLFSMITGDKKEVVKVESTPVATKTKPTYVIFITDGDCNDHNRAEAEIRRVSSAPIFWQFVGMGKGWFNFLEKLDTMPGRVVDNANFFSVANIASMSDDDLYRSLLSEYPQW